MRTVLPARAFDNSFNLLSCTVMAGAGPRLQCNNVRRSACTKMWWTILSDYSTSSFVFLSPRITLSNGGTVIRYIRYPSFFRSIPTQRSSRGYPALIFNASSYLCSSSSARLRYSRSLCNITLTKLKMRSCEVGWSIYIYSFIHSSIPSSRDAHESPVMVYCGTYTIGLML